MGLQMFLEQLLGTFGLKRPSLTCSWTASPRSVTEPFGRCGIADFLVKPRAGPVLFKYAGCTKIAAWVELFI